MSEQSILLCMGTRPEIIKMAPVYHALKQTSLYPIVLHTGQHREMAWPLYEFFDMRPAFRLELERERPSLSHLQARLLDKLDGVLERIGVEAVLVHGDTTSALAAAMAAYYAHLPVGHVEAGLRSHNESDPFPEEKNREMIARLARWHFAPTFRAMDNLRREGCPADRIHYVGNTIVDAAQWGMDRLLSHFTQESARSAHPTAVLGRHAHEGRMVLVTAHRRENWGEPLARITRAVRTLAETHDDLRFVWPVHPNPLVGEEVKRALVGMAPEARERILLCDPLNYPQMLWTLRHAWIVLTDSGGIQEEAAALEKPTLVLRKTTERPELIEAGGGVLVGTRTDTIVHWVDGLARDDTRCRAMRCRENPYGDGHAGRYIAETLVHAFAESEAPAALHPAPSRPATADVPASVFAA